MRTCLQRYQLLLVLLNLPLQMLNRFRLPLSSDRGGCRPASFGAAGSPTSELSAHMATQTSFSPAYFAALLRLIRLLVPVGVKPKRVQSCELVVTRDAFETLRLRSACLDPSLGRNLFVGDQGACRKVLDVAYGAFEGFPTSNIPFVLLQTR